MKFDAHKSKASYLWRKRHGISTQSLSLRQQSPHLPQQSAESPLHLQQQSISLEMQESEQVEFQDALLECSIDSFFVFEAEREWTRVFQSEAHYQYLFGHFMQLESRDIDPVGSIDFKLAEFVTTSSVLTLAEQRVLPLIRQHLISNPLVQKDNPTVIPLKTTIKAPLVEERAPIQIEAMPLKMTETLLESELELDALLSTSKTPNVEIHDWLDDILS